MDDQIGYSSSERLLHKIAFSSPSVQLSAEDLESSLYRKAFDAIDAARPVFITSLPRAGTTMMLEVLSSLPEFAAATYRDMPFILAPILWSKLSGRFQKQSNTRERAHGDGIEIGYDSPEAFEEVFWKTHWPKHYKGENIEVWGEANLDDDATQFFHRHMQKIIALHGGADRPSRYLSKNNANVARLDLLPKMTDGGCALIVLRDPFEQSASLLRQHLRFLEMHKDDRFVERYMGDIGHYEFGALHRPLLFSGFSDLTSGKSPTDLDYWLAYWISAFETVAQTASNSVIAPFERICTGGASALVPLLDALDVNQRDGLEQSAARLNAPQMQADPSRFDPDLARRARELHAELLTRAPL